MTTHATRPLAPAQPVALPPFLALHPVPAPPPQARSALLWGDAGVARVAVRTAAAAVKRGIAVAVIDGAMAFEVTAIAAAAQARRVPPERWLRQIHIARAFTCHQVATLLCERLEPLLASQSVGLIILIMLEASPAAYPSGLLAVGNSRCTPDGGDLRRFDTTPPQGYGGIDRPARAMDGGIVRPAGEPLVPRPMTAAPEPFRKAVAPDRAGLLVALDGRFPGAWRAALGAAQALPVVLGHPLSLPALPGGTAPTAGGAGFTRRQKPKKSARRERVSLDKKRPHKGSAWLRIQTTATPFLYRHSGAAAIGCTARPLMNSSEPETQPNSSWMAKREPSWLLLGKPYPIGSVIQSASKTHK
jgi:hypothetical protein